MMSVIVIAIFIMIKIIAMKEKSIIIHKTVLKGEALF